MTNMKETAVNSVKLLSLYHHLCFMFQIKDPKALKYDLYHYVTQKEQRVHLMYLFCCEPKTQQNQRQKKSWEFKGKVYLFSFVKTFRGRVLE